MWCSKATLTFLCSFYFSFLIDKSKHILGKSCESISVAPASRLEHRLSLAKSLTVHHCNIHLSNACQRHFVDKIFSSFF